MEDAPDRVTVWQDANLWVVVDLYYSGGSLLIIMTFFIFFETSKHIALACDDDVEGGSGHRAASTIDCGLDEKTLY